MSRGLLPWWASVSSCNEPLSKLPIPGVPTRESWFRVTNFMLSWQTARYTEWTVRNLTPIMTTPLTTPYLRRRSQHRKTMNDYFPILHHHWPPCRKILCAYSHFNRHPTPWGLQTILLSFSYQGTKQNSVTKTHYNLHEDVSWANYCTLNKKHTNKKN